MESCKVTMTNGNEAELLVKYALLMVLAPSLSAQWPLNLIGLELKRCPTNTKLGIHAPDNVYQSLYFHRDDYDVLKAFLLFHGFPVYQRMVLEA